MILASHLLIGAVIGAKIKHLGLIFVLALVSHFILDKIPHWDYGNRAVKRFLRTKSYKILFIFCLQVILDALVGLIIVFLIVWQKDMLKTQYLIPIFIGILGATLPDILLGAASLLRKKFKKLSKTYRKFHEETLHCHKHILKPTPIGLGTEIVATLIAILILIL